MKDENENNFSLILDTLYNPNASIYDGHFYWPASLRMRI